MIALLCSVAALAFIYFKLIVPFLYWRRRGIFCVKPWTRFLQVFLGKQPFVNSIRTAYSAYPDKRYYGSYQFLRPALFVRDVDLIKQITAKDFEHFPDHPSISNENTDSILELNLFSLQGQKWREMRSTLSPAFTSNKMRAMFTLMADTAQNFTKHFLTQPEEITVLEMKDIFTKYTNDVIANCAFGIKLDSLLDAQNEFYAMGKYVSAQTPLRVLRAVLYGFFPKIFQFFNIPALPTFVSDFFLRIVREAIHVRKAEGIVRPDMIHLLMEARKGRLQSDKVDSEDTGFATVQESEIGKANYAIDITDEVITAQALVFFLAGFTTASSLMSFMTYELAVAPNIQEQLQHEIDTFVTDGKLSYDDVLKMKFLDQVVSEALRKYPPGYILSRICVKDYVIPAQDPDEKTVTIDKGCLVTIPTIGLHYNPEFFPEPEKFDPSRFNDDNRGKIVTGSYLPFGAGPRNCIGSRFALLEIKVLMASLLSNFNLVPVQKTVIPLELAKSLSLEAKGGIWLGLQRRK